jgi:TolB-like protein
MKNKSCPVHSIAGHLGILFCVMVIGCATAAPRSTPTSRAVSPPPLFVQKTVAVADFEGGSVPPRQEMLFWRQGLASLLIADLRLSDNLKVVDRHHLATVLREQRLSISDLADPTTRLRVGGILGADFLIFGTYTIIGDTTFLTAQMDDVKTGKIVKAEKTSGKVEAMGQMSRALSIHFLRRLDEKLAAEEEKRLATDGGPPLEAVRYFSAGLDLESLGRYSEAVEMYMKALTVYPHYLDARKHLEKASEAAVRQ